MKCDKCDNEPPKLFASFVSTDSELAYQTTMRLKPWPWDWCPFCAERELKDPNKKRHYPWADVQVWRSEIGTMREEE